MIGATGSGIEATKFERNMPRVVLAVCYTVALLCIMSTLLGFFENGVGRYRVARIVLRNVKYTVVTDFWRR